MKSLTLNGTLHSADPIQAHLRMLGAGIARLRDIVLITEMVPNDAPEPRIVFVNKAFEKTTGYSSAEALGQTLTLLQRQNPGGSGSCSIRSTMMCTEPACSELLCCRKDGTEFWLELDISPMSDDVSSSMYWIAIGRDITSRKTEMDALRLSEQRWRFALEEAVDGVWEANLVTGEILYSKRYADLLGFTENELRGNWSDWENRIHPDDIERVRLEDLSNFDIRTEKYTSERRERSRDGRWKWLMVRGKVVSRDINGNPTLLIGSHTDITETKNSAALFLELNESLEERVRERTQELALARAEADLANLAKSDFLANMSHELRTPLNTVIGMTYLALGSVQDQKQRDYLNKIHFSGGHLLRIIDDILDFSKIEAGMLKVDEVDFLISNVADNLRQLLASKAEEKGLHLRIIVDQTIPAYLSGDPLRLGQILLNFTGNAIKFTACGAIEVQIEKLTENQDSCVIRFAVRDTGIGLSEAEQDALFQPFRQADASTARKYGGTGLGLAISKRLAGLMGGTVGVDSSLGHGSTFWLALPLKKPNLPFEYGSALKPYQAVQGSPSNDSDFDQFKFTGCRILVVEDNLFNQEIATELLEAVDAAVTVVDNGLKAVDLLRSERFDSVLMDIQMPVMDGLEATRQLRARPELANMPIIAMTANATNHDRQRCAEVGMNDFVSKPVRAEHLYATLKKWLGNKNFGTLTEASTPGINDTTPLRSDLVDLSLLAEMVGNQPEKIRKFALLFITSCETGLADADEAMARHDLKTVSALGHRMKSTAKTVGAMGFAELCDALEHIDGNHSFSQAEAIVSQLHPLFIQIKQRIDRDLKSQLQEKAETSNQQAKTGPDKGEVAHLPIDTHARVMAIDDESFQLDVVKTMLARIGFNDVLTELDSNLALVRIIEEQPDLLLCDLSMPGMDGIEFLRLLAAQGFRGGVILLSGMDTGLLKAAESLGKAHGLNLLGSLRKPVDIDTLRNSMAQLHQSKPASRSASLVTMLTFDDLQQGMREDLIEIFFQPKVSLRERRMVGAECLARWRHPERGIVSPLAFIPMLEKHGMIDAFTLLVLKKSAIKLGQWMREGHNFKIAVNVSMDNLNNLHLPEIFSEIVREAGVPPSHIVLEMTESRLMSNLTLSLEILARLRLKGFGLSIDDFGTGFSTMENLKQLPFSELKIDRAFVNGAAKDEAARAIFESSVHLGQIFHLNLVAEGVETQEDWDFVRNSGCHEVQGYFAAIPMPAEDLIHWKTCWENGSI